MCDFCRKIYEKDEKPEKYIDHIRKIDGGIYIYMATGDSFADFYYKIKYCPMCGRNLFDGKETPIEHFLKTEIERSESRINVYAECFDGVHVDNDTRKKLLESHIGFCKDALKNCSVDGKMVEN